MTAQPIPRGHPHPIAATLLAAFLGLGSAPGAELSLTIVEAGHDAPIPARVRIRDAAGQDHVPPGSQVVRIGEKDRWFVSDGRSRLSLPAGRVDVRVERGTEYSPARRSVDVAEIGTTECPIALTRWVNMRERGYSCGENHLHVPVEELAPQLVAEGLDFGNSLQWWNGPKYQAPPGSGFIRTLEFAGRLVPTSVYDVEIEHEWGAVYLTGVPEPLNEKSQKARPNLDVVRVCHAKGALVAYQGGYSREALLDALLGCVDVINVCNNNFHRHRFQPRSRYSNLLNVEGFPVYPGTPEGMMRMNTDSYYRLLNCGLRLAAGAESATGAKFTPVGYNRTYVRAGERPTLPEFLEAWRKGRNFATCGPMLFLKVNGRYERGDTIALDQGGGTLEIEVEAIADQTITSLEVVVNGQPIDAKPAIEDKTARLSARLAVGAGSWIAARCTEEDRFLCDAELNAYDAGENARPCRLRFAHTSPVYVTVAGKGPRVESSVRRPSACWRPSRCSPATGRPHNTGRRSWQPLQRHARS